MKYFSMFSGIGGFEYGIREGYNNYQYEPEKSRQTDSESRGIRVTSKQGRSVLPTNNTPLCIGFSEIDKYAIQIYRKHFPEHKNWGSATEIVPEQLPDFDMLCGGFPCQAFSIAGKRMGFEDTRGTLFFDIARIVKDKRPRILFLENVKGLLNHDNGRTFATILATLDELGYNVEWEVLNSKHFGVPQNRERVFIIGHLRGTSSKQIFPFGKSSSKNNEESKLHDYTRTITTAHAHGTAKHMSYVKAVLTPNRPEKRQNGRRFKEVGEEMFTLTGQDIHGINYNNRIRRLTPIECERLQGFPDNWTECVSDTQRYKCLGNAVTTNVIEAIMDKYFEELKEQGQK